MSRKRARKQITNAKLTIPQKQAVLKVSEIEVTISKEKNLLSTGRDTFCLLLVLSVVFEAFFTL